MINIEEYLKENGIPINSPLANNLRECAKYLEGSNTKLQDICKHNK